MAELAYKCPNCGAPIDFSIDSQKMHCQYCGSDFPVEQVEQFNSQSSPPSQSPAPPTDAPLADDATAHSVSLAEFNYDSTPTETWTPSTEEGLAQFICNSCGGEIIGDPDVVSTRCPYCDNNFIAISQLTSTRMPDRMIQFKVNKERAVQTILDGTKKLRFLPSTFTKQHKIEEVTGVYVPYWLYDSNVNANISYTAEKISTWSDSTYHYTKTDYYQLYRAGQIAFADIPVSGTTKLVDEHTEAIEPFIYKETVPFSPAYLTGFAANKYDIDEVTASARAKERLTTSVLEAFKQTANKYTVVTVVNSDLKIHSGVVEYVFLPVWVLNLRHNDKVFNFSINGQTGKSVGQYPISWAKFWAWFAGLSVGFSLLSSAVVLAYTMWG